MSIWGSKTQVDCHEDPYASDEPIKEGIDIATSWTETIRLTIPDTDKPEGNGQFSRVWVHLTYDQTQALIVGLQEALIYSLKHDLIFLKPPKNIA